MKNKLGITEGEWMAEREFSKKYNQFIFRIENKEETHSGFVVVFSGTDNNNDDLYKMAEANSKLLTDAGTTANKCGLLPSDLLKQRDELLEALKKLREYHLIDIDEEGQPNASALDITDNWFKVSKLIQSIE